MLKHFQRLGGALFAPVLLFPFAGLVVALTIILKNPDFVGELANTNGTFYKMITVIEEGGWTVFRQLPLIFAIGLPIGLAKKAHPRACLAVLATYLTYNYFISAILTFWGPSFGVDFTQNVGGVSGLTTIAGIKTLDTSIVGAIVISGITIYIHNKFFDTKLPDFLGTFQGTTLVSAIAFVVMIPCAYITCLVWSKIQMGISSLQALMVTSGREDEEEETKLYTKADWKAKNGEGKETNSSDLYSGKAKAFLEAFGGKDNIEQVNNCATRLRISVKDEKKVGPDIQFKAAGAHGVVRNGKAFQVIVGLSVPQVRESFENLMEQN